MANHDELYNKSMELDNLFFVENETGRIREWYFNPESSHGGAIVENVYTSEDISKAAEDYGLAEDFYSAIESESEQYYHDIDIDNFEELLDDLIAKQRNEEYTFIGADTDTMLELISFAEEYIRGQSKNFDSLKTLLDTGEHKNIIVYNKYGDFIATGNPHELRENGLWGLIDEQNAVVKETFPGIIENKEPATCIVLSNFPWKDRSRAELQAQFESLQKNADFSEFTDDDLKKQAVTEFNMRINNYKSHLESARCAELRKAAEEIESLWYVNEETGRICNVYFKPYGDIDMGGAFVECVIQAEVLLEVMEDPIKELGEPVSDYFLDFFEGSAKMTNTDIKTSEFEVLLNELKDDIANKIYTFKGDSPETLNSVMEVAKRIAEPEKTRQIVKQAQQHVYMKSAEHAKENGESLLYSQSHGNNVLCIIDIGEEIKKHTTYGEMAGISHVDTEKALKEILGKHSAERVCIMTALNVERFDYDARISSKNKVWASEINTPLLDWRPTIDAHATVVDSFVDKVREAYTRARDAFFEQKGRCNLDEIYDYMGKEVSREVAHNRGDTDFEFSDEVGQLIAKNAKKNVSLASILPATLSRAFSLSLSSRSMQFRSAFALLSWICQFWVLLSFSPKLEDALSSADFRVSILSFCASISFRRTVLREVSESVDFSFFANCEFTSCISEPNTLKERLISAIADLKFFSPSMPRTTPILCIHSPPIS